jgi:hypothetical protein
VETAHLAPRDRTIPGPVAAAEEGKNPMSENFERLVATVEKAREDVDKAEAGNKAATARVRKSMQEIKSIAQDIRKEMLELRDGSAS